VRAAKRNGADSTQELLGVYGHNCAVGHRSGTFLDTVTQRAVINGKKCKHEIGLS